MGTAAAWSKKRVAGLGASLPVRARAYSADEPLPIPNTSSPGLTPVTLVPAASTEAPARVEVLRPAETKSCDADRGGQTGHHVPGAPVHPGRAHPYQDFLISTGGPVHLLEPQHILGRGAVPVLAGRLHAATDADQCGPS